MHQFADFVENNDPDSRTLGPVDAGRTATMPRISTSSFSSLLGSVGLARSQCLGHQGSTTEALWDEQAGLERRGSRGSSGLWPNFRRRFTTSATSIFTDQLKAPIDVFQERFR